jgi:putative addiction module killer protein
MEVRQTAAFSNWMARLRDQRARTKIAARIDRLAQGNVGDVQPVGKALASCEYIMAPVIEFILYSGPRR